VDPEERYRIETELGSGGMGVVYRAVDTLLGRPVALKRLHRHLMREQGLVARFQAEARAAARLDHPNVVAVHDVGELDGELYFTMQYVEGESLRAVIDRQGPLPLDQLLWLGGQLASALDYVHRHGVIHRDIKPENILLDASGNARITDFGIARAANHTRLTVAGTMMGTPEYMSPEQVKGAEVDHRTDIYSLGVLLFEMGTGQVPFAGDTPFAVGMQHCEQAPPDPALLQPAYPPWLSTVVQRCLAKLPDQRFATAGEVASALHAQQPVMVPPPQRVTPPPTAATVIEPVAGTPPPAAQASPTPPPVAQASPTPPPVPQSTPTPAPGPSRAPWMVVGVLIGVLVLLVILAGGFVVLLVLERSEPEVVAGGEREEKEEKKKKEKEKEEEVEEEVARSVAAVEAAEGEAPAYGAAAEREARDRVRERYDDWVRAWESRDIDRYMAFYSTDVRIKRAGRSPYEYHDLRTRMGSHWKKLTYIRIDDGEPTLTVSGSWVYVEVWHDYDSDTWWDRGTKHMAWQDEGGEWRIVEESFDKEAGGRK